MLILLWCHCRLESCTLLRHSGSRCLLLASLQFQRPVSLEVSDVSRGLIESLDLCNMIAVDFLEPAWCLPNQAPLGGEVRIVGSNFVDLPTDKAKPLKARLAAALPTYVLQNANPTTLEATLGKGSVDTTTISYELFTVHLQIVRLSNTELGTYLYLFLVYRSLTGTLFSGNRPTRSAFRHL